MGNSNDLKMSVLKLADKLDLSKIKRLQSLIPELKNLDELLGHNAETALEHLQAKAEPQLAEIPSASKNAVMELLMNADADAVEIASRMIEYNLPNTVLLFIHIDDFLDHTSDIPLVSPGASEMVQRFLTSNSSTHLVIISHENADITAILASTLAGTSAIKNGQVSMVYESGMGLYLGSDPKQKKDLLSDDRHELIHLLERMAVVTATKMGDKHFKDNFFFTATEYSIGIRVHPFARGSSDSLDKDAADELVRALAIALSDLVKEDVSAVQSHVVNHFLAKDPSLSQIFAKSNDERVWDMEKVDQLLELFRFVHLGARGSIIRPADASDVQAADVILASTTSKNMIVVAGDSIFSKPLLEWALAEKKGFIACSDAAEKSVNDLVETRGGIVYSAGHISELLDVIGAYSHLKSIIK